MTSLTASSLTSWLNFRLFRIPAPQLFALSVLLQKVRGKMGGRSTGKLIVTLNDKQLALT